MPGWELGKL